MIVEQAPAKINLALHVTGQRDDGYHEIESLVAFANFGDVLTVAPSESDALVLSGPFARDLAAGPDNLVIRARALLQGPFRTGRRNATGCAFTLEKNLPVASGIGGGSADAAAALRVLNKVTGKRFSLAHLRRISLPLGADLPMCVESKAAFVSGIGEAIEPVGSFASMPAVLVNPLTELSTGSVFKGLASKRNSGLPPRPAGGFSMPALLDYLAMCRNDLEAPARRRMPELGQVLAALGAEANCLIARMSGSGATCFALFPSDEDAAMAAKRLARAHPHWWIKPCRIEDDPFGFDDPGRTAGPADPATGQ